MLLELKTDGIDFVGSKLPEPKNDENGRQRANRTSGELLFVTELVVMGDTGAEVIKVTTCGAALKVSRRLVALPSSFSALAASRCRAPRSRYSATASTAVVMAFAVLDTTGPASDVGYVLAASTRRAGRP